MPSSAANILIYFVERGRGREGKRETGRGWQKETDERKRGRLEKETDGKGGQEWCKGEGLSLFDKNKMVHFVDKSVKKVFVNRIVATGKNNTLK